MYMTKYEYKCKHVHQSRTESIPMLKIQTILFTHKNSIVKIFQTFEKRSASLVQPA